MITKPTFIVAARLGAICTGSLLVAPALALANPEPHPTPTPTPHPTEHPTDHPSPHPTEHPKPHG